MSNHILTASEHALSSGSILHDNYIVERVLGEGGFGITYYGTNLSNERKVAIKEYFPSGVASRINASTNSQVDYYDRQSSDSFQKGMRRFLNEASILRDFQHLDSIVSVFDIFEENNTAYIVMEYIEGITLKELIHNEGSLSYNEMISLFKPLLFDLHEVHKMGLIHRDISPDNIIVGMDNHLHLIDFGAASFKNPNATKTMTVILKSGYAPPEQYISDGKVGPWTDVYGLCATMYMVLNGEKPIDAIRRMQNDTLEFSDECSSLEKYQKDAILRGLRLNHAERFSSAKILYQALTTVPTDDVTETVESAALSDKLKKQVREIDSQTNKRKPTHRILFLCVLLSILLVSYYVLRTLNVQHTLNGHNPIIGSATDIIRTNISKQALTFVEENPTILTMVNVTGKSLLETSSILQKLDSTIEINVIKEYSSDVREGYVISQSIAENTQFSRGQITQIQLVVSQGREPTTQAPRRTSSGGSTSNNTNNTSNKQSNDGYTTIHLD